MIAMEPVWKFLNNLEGFDFAAFWIALFTLIILSGFFLDYIMQRQGFGPYLNSIFVVLGLWLGLWVRFNYLKPNEMHLNDPFLSVGSILCVLAVMLLGM